MATVTPWEVKGNIDYDKIVKEFGVQRIDKPILDFFEKAAQKKGLELHPFLKRNVFFAHRDLTVLIKELKKETPFYLYTGRAPSAGVHIGHLVPLQFTKWLQDVFDVELWFQFPDEEKVLFKRDLTFEKIAPELHENLLDVISIGFNPKKTNFLIDTRHADFMYKQGCRVAKQITFSAAKSAFGFTPDQNIGAIFYTSMQAVPAFLPMALTGKKMMCLIPHAIDQDPHFRLTRDVLPKLGYPKPASIQCRFLPSLKGMQEDGKMSSSSGQNATLYLSDNAKTIKKKINKYAFSGGQATIEEHRQQGGNPDIDVSYQWLTFFEEDDQKIQELYTQYKSGELLSGEMKKELIEVLTQLLGAYQKNREKAESLLPKFLAWEKKFRK